MKKKLIIHFGVHRTGTTSLQQTLKANVNHLFSAGFLYPDLGHNYNHGKIAWGLIQNKKGQHQITLKSLVDSLLEASNHENIHTIILSHEDFCLVENNDWLKALKKYFDLTAVVYLRRQDAWLESWYNQHIKWPWDKELSGATSELFLSKINDFFWIDYHFLLTKISHAIGNDHLYVNLLDSSGIKDTTQDFLSFIKIDGIETIKEQNASLTSAQIDILRRINIVHLKPAARNKIISTLKEINIKEDNGSTAVFSDDQLRSIHEKFLTTNQMVAKMFFNRDRLFYDNPTFGRDLALVTDHRAYRIYIPQLLKKVASL